MLGRRFVTVHFAWRSTCAVSEWIEPAQGISAGVGCDQYEDVDEEAWLECQSEGVRGVGQVDWST
jgi:hypothetical protein